MTPTCTALSAADDEPLAGSAPSDVEWLFIERPGPWGRDAPGDLGLVVPGVRVQLIRRHGGGASGPGVRLFRASLGPTVAVRTAVVASIEELGSPLDTLPWEPYDEPLLLVCTNGKRDRCCSELGRPVTAALAARWPEATWETTHLGGHRFSATLLALPSAITLGRVATADAVDACASVLAGELPLELVRGRAGLPGPAQAAELAVRRDGGWRGLADVTVERVEVDQVRLRTPAGPRTATVTTTPGVPRRQSCGDGRLKAAPTYAVEVEPGRQL